MKKGWQTKTLGDICLVDWGNTDLTKSSYVEGGKFLAVSAAGCDGRIGHKEHTKYTPVLSAIGAQCGRMFLPEEDFTAIKNTITLTPRDGICTGKFLYQLLTHIELPKRGAAQPFIAKGDILKFSIPVPPLAEQQRIVGLLDEAFEGIAAAKANAEKNLQNARALFESHLQSVFTQRGPGWVEKSLGDESLVQIIDGDRGTNYPKSEDFLDEGHCLFLNTKNVRPDGFEFDSTMFITEEKDRQLRKGKLQRNDVILTTRGTIGNIGLYSEDVPFDHVRINSGMLIFRPNKNLLLPEYLFELFRSPIVREQIRKQTTGAAQPQLPIKTLVTFKVPVPKNLADQRALVLKLREFEPETQRLARLYEQKLAALEALKKSLLHQAFTGQL